MARHNFAITIFSTGFGKSKHIFKGVSAEFRHAIIIKKGVSAFQNPLFERNTVFVKKNEFFSLFFTLKQSEKTV
jgi:hypothetical protein